jgi:hypothetical protein
MKKQNILFESIKDLSDKQIISGLFALLVLISGSGISLGGWLANQNNVNTDVSELKEDVADVKKDVSNMSSDLKIIAIHLENLGSIPVNCAFKTDTVPKEIYLADNKIYRKKPKRRIANNETALDNLDFENTITE